MSEEEIVVPAVDPAPEQGTTAAPEPEAQEPEVAKTFTQEELDSIISKRLAREERKWAREQALKPAAVPSEPPTPGAYETTEEHLEAMAEYKAALLVEKRETARQHAVVEEAYNERVDEAREKFADFDQVARNPNLPVTAPMAEAITSSELGPEILYHLGLNPKEADRISRLSPILQAKEIGRIEAKLVSDPPTKKTTNAPAPINPVTPGGAAKVYDTTDPRSIKTMTTSEWIEAERARQRKKMEQRR